MSKQKSKGTRFETLIKDYLIKEGFSAERQVLNGAKDTGDIKVFGVDAVFELKNQSRFSLAEWIQETEVERKNAKRRFGFTIFKRRGKGLAQDQYALMPLSQLVELIKEAYPDATDLPEFLR